MAEPVALLPGLSRRSGAVDRLGPGAQLGAQSEAHRAALSSASTRASPVLQRPALDEVALQALSQDELAHNRLEELAFAKASEQLRQVAKDGNRAATKRALDALQKRFGQHPWLSAKIAQLRHLADEDTELMAKEVRYSMMRMSSRLASKSEMAYEDDETHLSESVMPSFLRKKVSEGKGKVR